MTMYARAITGVYSFGDPSIPGDHFTLSAASGVVVLPLWAAQFPGLQRAWAAGHVQVSQAISMTPLISSIPSDELGVGTIINGISDVPGLVTALAAKANAATSDPHYQIFYLDNYGVDKSGSTPIDTALGTVATALGSAPGAIVLPVGNLRLNASLTSLVGPLTSNQSIIGPAGRELATINYYGTGPAFEAYDTLAWVDQAHADNHTGGPGRGGAFLNFKIDGTNAGASADGLKLGDMEGILVDNVYFDNFSIAGSVGMYWISRYTWTERAKSRVFIRNCASGMVFELGASVYNSFNAGDHWMSFKQFQNQDGLVVRSSNANTALGAVVYHSKVTATGVFIAGTPSNQSGATGSNTGAGIRMGSSGTDVSQLTNIEMEFSVENSCTTGQVAHQTIVTGGAAASLLTGYGKLRFMQGLSPGNGWAPGNAAGHVVFSGFPIDVDNQIGISNASIPSARDLCFRGGNLAGMGGSPATAYLVNGNMVKRTLPNGALTINLDASVTARASTSETGCWDLILIQPSSGAAGTVSWPSGWVALDGTVNLATANNAVDWVRVITPDFVTFYYKHMNTATDTQVLLNKNLVDPSNLLPAVDPLTSNLTTIPRWSAFQGCALVTQTMQFMYRVADHAMTITSLTAYANATAASGLSLCRMGLYTVDDSGNLTLVASTPNDTTLFAVAFTGYTKALSVSYTVAAGATYAWGVLAVGTTPPSLYGVNSITTENALANRLTAQLAAQSDLPGSVTVGSLVASGKQVYMRAA